MAPALAPVNLSTMALVLIFQLLTFCEPPTPFCLGLWGAERQALGTQSPKEVEWEKGTGLLGLPEGGCRMIRQH